MAANRRKQDDKNLEILREFITINGNKYCLDCNQRGPTYVNATIGSFVCSKCSGMLRGLTPPHRVKSISMATFTPEEIEYIKARGNDYCRRIWLGLYEGESANLKDEQSIKDFMSDKYEKKRYYLEPNLNLNSHSLNNGNASGRNKTKTKSASTTNPPLVLISPQGSKPVISSASLSTSRPVHNTTSVGNSNFKSVQPSIGNVQRPISNANGRAPANPVPEFPVDFSTANIYNSSQHTNNNFLSQLFTPAPTNHQGGPPSVASATNDRYAALADLDMAARQQNTLKPIDDNNVSNRNPFQSATSSDFFANKNPFSNGGYNADTTSVHLNPFMSAANNGQFVNSMNPFL